MPIGKRYLIVKKQKQNGQKAEKWKKKIALKESWTLSTYMQSRLIDYYDTSSNFNWAGQTIVSL